VYSLKWLKLPAFRKPTNEKAYLLIYEGYTYIFEKNGADHKRICTKYTCKYTVSNGRCHTQGFLVIWSSENHNHAINNSEVGVKVLKATMKADAVANPSSSTSEALSASVKNVSLQVAAALP